MVVGTWLAGSAAAQAEICYGPAHALTTLAPPNASTTFSCPTAGNGTLNELAARGWRVVKVTPVQTSGGASPQGADRLLLQRVESIFRNGCVGTGLPSRSSHELAGQSQKVATNSPFFAAWGDPTSLGCSPMKRKEHAMLQGHRPVHNGRAGEAKTIAFLSDDFWHLERSIDAGGIDLVLQPAAESRRDAVAAPFDRVAFVQSKQFQRGGRAKIAADYVEAPDGGRLGYFVFVHSFDVAGTPIHWFFSAAEVVALWRRSDDGASYFFSRAQFARASTVERRSRREVRAMIEDGMVARRSRTRDAITTSFFEAHSNIRDVTAPCGSYLFLRPAACATVLYRDHATAAAIPLDARRDGFHTPGHFEWGYRGTGPQFLAASLLTHFFGGRRPGREEVLRVLNDLLDRLDQHAEHEITSTHILIALTGNSWAREVRSLSLSGHAEFRRLAALYDPSLVDDTPHISRPDEQ